METPPANREFKINHNLRPSISPSSPAAKSPQLARRNRNTPVDPHFDHEQSDKESPDYKKGSKPKKNVTMEEMSDPEPDTPSKPNHNKNAEDNKNKTSLAPWLVGIVVIVALLLTFHEDFLPFINLLKAQELQQSQYSLHCKFEKLRQEYNGQDGYLWKSLEAGLEDIINNRTDSPAIFLFMFKKNPSNEKEMVLINKIAKRASECFEPSSKPAQINREDFNSEAALDDYGTAIEKYKALIKQSNIISIPRLNYIPPTAARALHSICDAQNPIEKRVGIFLTLEVASLEGKHIEIAEDTLSNLWKNKIKDSEFRPLMTRVTDQVVVVKG